MIETMFMSEAHGGRVNMLALSAMLGALGAWLALAVGTVWFGQPLGFAILVVATIALYTHWNRLG